MAKRFKETGILHSDYREFVSQISAVLSAKMMLELIEKVTPEIFYNVPLESVVVEVSIIKKCDFFVLNTFEASALPTLIRTLMGIKFAEDKEFASKISDAFSKNIFDESPRYSWKPKKDTRNLNNVFPYVEFILEKSKPTYDEILELLLDQYKLLADKYPNIFNKGTQNETD